MARLFTSGFELDTSGSGDEWSTQTSSPSIQATVVRSGGYAMHITNLTSGVKKFVSQTFATTAGSGPYYFRYCLRVGTSPTAENSIFTVTDVTASTWYLRMTLSSTNTLQLYDEDGAIGSPSSALTAGTFYIVEVMVDRTAAGGSHIVKARLNLVEFASATNRNISAVMDRARFGGNLNAEAQTTGVWYMDDIAINDSTGSYENDYPGEGKVITLEPDGAGDNTGWTPTAGSNYQCVDEVNPNDTTDYVSASANNTTDDYTMRASGIGSTDTVSVVTSNLRARRATTGTVNTQIVARLKAAPSGTVTESSTETVSSTTWRTNDMGTNTGTLPLITSYVKPGTSDVWTQTDLDAMQTGMRVNGTGYDRPAQITKVWSTFEYIPTTLKTQTGISRITKTVSQTQTGKARITASTTRTQTGVSNISSGAVTAFNTFYDNFDDNAIDTAKWDSFATNSSVSETNNRLEITTSTSAGNAGYTSDVAHNLTGDSVSIEVVNAGNQALTKLEAYPVFLFVDSNNQLFYLIENGTLSAIQRVAGVNTTVSSASYNSTTHRWLRIREASGTTYWDYSANGVSWSNLTSTSNPITVTALFSKIQGGTWSGEASTSTIIYDNYNAVVTQRAQTGVSRITKTVTQTQTGKANISAAPSSDSISFDAVSSDSAGALSWSHTVGGTDKLLVVGTQVRDVTIDTVTGITYNGVALTKVAHADNGIDIRAELWYLVNPASGTNTIDVTFSATPTRASAGAISLNGVDQTTPIEVSANATGSSDTPTINITPLSDYAWVVSSIAFRAAGNFTAGAGETERYDETGGSSHRGFGSTTGPISPAASTTISATNAAGTDTWGIVVGAIKPIGIPSTTTTKTQTGISRITKVVSQTQTGKGRITVTVTRTQTGKARITATTTRTQTGISRVSVAVTRTQTGLARIQKAVTRDQTGKARITVTVTRTQTGISRITLVVARTQTGIARITASTTRTQTGKAAILLTTQRNQTGKSAIKRTTTQTQTGVSRVQLVATKTQTGIARIEKVVTRTQTGISRVTVSTQRNVLGVSRITASTARTQTGVSRITVSVTRTQTGKAAVLRTTTRTQTGVSRVSLVTIRSQTGVSRITVVVARTQTGISRITVVTTRTQTGKSAIKQTTTRNQTGISAIRFTITRTQTGVSRIEKSVTKTQTGISRITVTVTRTQTGISRITVSVLRTQTGVAKITATTTRTQTGKAAVLKSTLRTQTGVARISLVTTRDQTGKARIAYTTLKTQTGVARITKVVQRDQTGKARITASTSRTQTGVARISLVTQRTQTGVARITVATSRTQTGKASILKATLRTQTGIARIQITTSRTQTGVARISVAVNRTQTGVSRISLVTTRNQTGKSSVLNAVLRTQTGIARITVATTRTQTGVAKITASTTRTQTGVARVTVSTTRTQTGTSRVLQGGSYNQTGIARITVIVARTQTGVAKIEVATTRAQTGKARIQLITTRNQTGVSRIALVTQRTQTGVSRISLVATRTQTGKARIGLITTKDQTGKARITSATTRTQTGVSRIAVVVSRTQTGVARIGLITTRNQTGKAYMSGQWQRTQTGISRITGVTTRNQTGKAYIERPRDPNTPQIKQPFVTPPRIMRKPQKPILTNSGIDRGRIAVRRDTIVIYPKPIKPRGKRR